MIYWYETEVNNENQPKFKVFCKVLLANPNNELKAPLAGSCFLFPTCLLAEVSFF